MDWNKPIHPAHALAFVGICACGGFIAGVGLAALLSALVARKVVDGLMAL